MNNNELNRALLAFGEEHFGKHENVSLFFWNDHDGALRVRWILATKNGAWAQGSGDTLADARQDWIARRAAQIASLETDLAALKAL
jgi:hypothetical protein